MLETTITTVESTQNLTTYSNVVGMTCNYDLGTYNKVSVTVI